MPNATEHTNDGPNYDVEIDANELLADLAEMAADYGLDYEEKREWWRDSWGGVDPFPEAKFWMLEAWGGLRALSYAIAALQPESYTAVRRCFREDDGTVDVRGYMRWLTEESRDAHDRRGRTGETPQASEAESAYVSVLSLLRDEYGVGWPRMDEHGNPLERDQP